MQSKQPINHSKHVTDARAAAQRAKLDAQAQSRLRAAQQAAPVLIFLASYAKEQPLKKDLVDNRSAYAR